jgi:hypothetical protein
MLPLGGGVARNGATRFLGGAGESLEVTLWLFYIANWKMAHLQMIVPLKLTPPFISRIFQFAMLVMTRG